MPAFVSALRKAFARRRGRAHGPAHVRKHGRRRHSRPSRRRLCALLGGRGWLVPHFEKMLYDNAQLAQLYLDAHLVVEAKAEAARAAEPFAVARDILDYVLRDMTHPGRRLLFRRRRRQRRTRRQILLLDARRTCRGCSRRRNSPWRPSISASPSRATLWTTAIRIRCWAKCFEHCRIQIAHATGRRCLCSIPPEKNVRRAGQRIRPHLDDKILASWNGLMLGAIARASVF